MKRTFFTAALAFAVASSGAFVNLTAQAQTADRVYDNGPVWTISRIETKPGMFNDYMKYVSTSFTQIQEAGKKAGYILDYKVLSVDSPRDHEADVILMVEYKNMAAFDRSFAEQDAVTSTVFGSVPKSSQAAVARESMRTLRGSMTARELLFKK